MINYPKTRTPRFWTEERQARVRQRWLAGESKTEIMEAEALTRGQFAGAMMRLNLQPRPGIGKGNVTLPEYHPAVVQSRTMWPLRVRDPLRDMKWRGVFKQGRDNRKLGDVVTKGAWRGMPIYSLTLEERATCPKSCHHWRDCYGNSMQLAVRNRHGSDLEDKIEAELGELQSNHPGGFVVRIHVLGDFYSQFYAGLWRDWLNHFRALHVWGYTARPRHSPIGRVIRAMNETPHNRCSIRFSQRKAGPGAAITIRHHYSNKVTSDVIICPVETGKTRSCATCGLCWSPAAAEKTIAFLLH